MKKVLLLMLFVSVLFHLSTTTVDAALLRFTRAGELYWNILGTEDATEDTVSTVLEVTKIADKVVSGQKIPVSVSNTNGKITLSYGEISEEPTDITGYKEEIIEIEEKNVPKSIRIAASETGFYINQRGITAETAFPITINSPENMISLKTGNGDRYLRVLPYEAVNQIVRTNIITNVLGDRVSLVEKDEGEVTYVINGEKNIVLFNIISLQIPITVEVSAVTGSVINIDQPVWYSALDFLLA